MNDILVKMNSQHVTLLVMLHLSAAFDTFNHKIWLERLQHDIGISRVPLQCFKVVHTGQIRAKRAHFNKPNESCLNS